SPSRHGGQWAATLPALCRPQRSFFLPHASRELWPCLNRRVPERHSQILERSDVRRCVPFVHEKLLEFKRQDADVFLVLRMQPQRKETTREFHVLTHIERALLELLALQGRHEGVDEGCPAFTVHGAGSYIDLRILHDAFARFVRTTAAMVVAVDVQDENAVPSLDQLIEKLRDFSIEAVVLRRRPLDYAFGRARAPQFEAPAIFRVQSNCLVPRSIE